MSEPIIAFSKGKQFFLPLLDLASTLGLRIEATTPDVYQLTTSKEEILKLEFSNCKKAPTPLCEQQINHHGVQYIDYSYLKENLTWPITLDLKNMQLIVDVADDGSSPDRPAIKSDRPYELQRELLGYPAARVEASLNSRSQHLSTLYMSQPLLHQDSDLIFSANDNNVKSRWTLSKQYFDAESPLALRNYELLWTQTLDTKYIFFPANIIGLKLSNINSDEILFDNQSLADKAPPRWRIQLFINDVFQAETQADINGQFLFVNVPLFYGINHIRYRMISPMGKIKEVKRVISVSGDAQGRGKFKYQMAYGQLPTRSTMVGGANLNFGITSHFSTQLGLAKVAMPNTFEEKTFSTLTANYFVSALNLSLSKMNSLDQKDQAWVASSKFNTGAILMKGEVAFFDHWSTPLINSTGLEPIRSLKKLSLQLPLPAPIAITSQFNLQEQTDPDHKSLQLLQARLFALFHSSSVILDSTTNLKDLSSRSTTLEYGKYSPSFRWRYGISMNTSENFHSHGTLEYLFKNEVYLTTSAEWQNLSTKDGVFTLGLTKSLGEIQAELNLSQSRHQTSGQILLATNIKTSPRGIDFKQEESYRQGRLRIFAFIDENSNGRHEPGEPPLQDLKVTDLITSEEFVTDDKGELIIPAIQPYQRVSLKVVRESVKNIYLSPKDFDRDFVLTPAQQWELNLPVFPSFDIKGRLLNSYFKKLVPVELLDIDRKVKATTVTNANGHFKFQDLPGGIYFVRINPSFLRQNNLLSEPEFITVTLRGQPGIQTLKPFQISVRQGTQTQRKPMLEPVDMGVPERETE